jgi:hypothetical protein
VSAGVIAPDKSNQAVTVMMKMLDHTKCHHHALYQPANPEDEKHDIIKTAAELSVDEHPQRFLPVK